MRLRIKRRKLSVYDLCMEHDGQEMILPLDSINEIQANTSGRIIANVLEFHLIEDVDFQEV